MTKRIATTTFRSRGRLTGLVRDEYPAGTGQNRTSRGANRESTLNGADTTTGRTLPSLLGMCGVVRHFTA